MIFITKDNTMQKIKLTESQLNELVTESVKRIVNEISYPTISRAEDKSEGSDDWHVEDAISTIENYLDSFYRESGSGQARKLLYQLNNIRDFYNRKKEQYKTFLSAREDADDEIWAEVGNAIAQLHPEFGKIKDAESTLYRLSEPEQEKVYSMLSQDTQKALSHMGIF